MSQTSLTQAINNWNQRINRAFCSIIDDTEQQLYPLFSLRSGYKPTAQQKQLFQFNGPLVSRKQVWGVSYLCSLVLFIMTWVSDQVNCGAVLINTLHSCPCHHHISDTQAAKNKFTKWQNKVFTHNSQHGIPGIPGTWIPPDELYGAILCLHQHNIKVLCICYGSQHG